MDQLMQFVPFLLMFGVFWLLILRPQMKEQRAHEALVKSLAKDDRVVTKSGLHGRVVSVQDTTVKLDVAKGTTITVERDAIQARLEQATN